MLCTTTDLTSSQFTQTEGCTKAFSLFKADLTLLIYSPFKLKVVKKGLSCAVQLHFSPSLCENRIVQTRTACLKEGKEKEKGCSKFSFDPSTTHVEISKTGQLGVAPWHSGTALVSGVGIPHPLPSQHRPIANHARNMSVRGL